MTKIVGYIGLLFFIPSVGMAAGMLLTIWQAGISYQPYWVRAVGALTAIIFILKYAYYSLNVEAKSFSFDKAMYALIGVVIIPLAVGYLVKGDLIFLFESNDGGKDASQLTISDSLNGLTKFCLGYGSLLINLVYIYEAALKPFWLKYI